MHSERKVYPERCALINLYGKSRVSDPSFSPGSSGLLKNLISILATFSLAFLKDATLKFSVKNKHVLYI